MARKLVLAVVVAVGLVTPAEAGFDEGFVAYNRGDYETALREFRPLGEQGNAGAQFNLGLLYEEGQGVPQDYVQAAKWYRKAAEQGHASAQFNLGLMYANGLGVAQNYAEALKWYRKAAEQGLAQAQTNLGLMYRKGQGVTQDDAEAVRWYRLAAEQGGRLGQAKLGVMYVKGLGVTQDYVQAHMWFNLAAAQGHKNAREGREITAKHMTLEQIAEAQRLAREWTPKPKRTESVNVFRDEDLRLVQSLLKIGGYDPGPVDGFMGERTRSAIASFKADTASTGTISESDQALLNLIEFMERRPAKQ